MDASADAGRSTHSRPTDAVGDELLRLRRIMESIRSRVLEHGAHGVEGSALSVLFHLVRTGDQRASALAGRVDLDPSTMSRHVTALVRSGHVERVPDPEDGRASLLRASDAGRRALTDTMRLRSQLIDSALRDWSEDDVQTFVRSLRTFNDCFAHLDIDAIVTGLTHREVPA